MSQEETVPPQTLAEGRYHLLEVLGEGGMAQVWCAWDERLQVHRAIKMLLPMFSARSLIRQRFLNEARTMARLHHPNIVAVHDVVEDDEQPFMVMELVRGGSLADYLEANGPMHPRLVADAGLAMLAALELSHDEGVVHRDIKPQNLLVTPRGKIKVTDFGIARVITAGEQGPALTRTGSTLGTWGFMAPEQRGSARQVDARADLYAVGATLFALLTNEIPVDLFTAELDDARVTGLPPVLEPLIRKACRYHPHDRFQSAAEMMAALRALDEALGQPPEGTPPLGGDVRALPVLGGGSGVAGASDTLTPPDGATFGLDDSNLPAWGESSGDGLGGDDLGDVGGTGLTRLDLPEYEPAEGKMGPRVAAVGVAVLLGAWLFWPSAEAPSSQDAQVTAEPASAAPAQLEAAEPVDAGSADAEGAADEVDAVELTENSSAEAEGSVTSSASGASSPPSEPREGPAGAPSQAPPDRAPAVGEPAEGEPAEGEPAEGEPAEGPWAGGAAEAKPTVTVSAPPRLGRVVVSGEVRSVVLIAADGGRSAPGEISPGRYTVEASFGDGPAAVAGKVDVVAGGTVRLTCNAAFSSCKAQ